MEIKVANAPIIVSKMFFLAYEASQVVGMGFLQAREGITEGNVTASLSKNVDSETDLVSWRADYVFGRMMKMNVKFDLDTIVLRDGELDIEYQSWSSTYPTYNDLYEAALKEVK